MLGKVQHHTDTWEAEHESCAVHIIATLSEVEKAVPTLRALDDAQSIRV